MNRAVRSIPRAIGVLALLAAFASITWQAIQLARTGAVAPTSTADSRGRAGDPAAPGMAPESANDPIGSSALGTSGWQSAPEREAAFKPGEIEVCGFGRAMADSEAAASLERESNAGLDRALQNHLHLMRQSGDAKTRAAALMALGEYAELVNLALRTQDPTIYAFGMQACERRAMAPAESQACQMLSAEQAARIDPDNAAVWLQLAARAQERRDADSVAAALHRATATTTVNQRAFEFAALAMAALPAQLSPAERTSTVVGLIGVQAALSIPALQVVASHCGEAQLADANRRQTCDALASLLVEKGRLFVEFGVGRRIGERVGWPRERTLLLAARLDAYYSGHIDDMAAELGGPVSCEAVRRGEQRWRAIGSQGEVGAAQSLLARKNLSPEELIARYQHR